jgi:hydroxyacylglutathione hydrolase
MRHNLIVRIPLSFSNAYLIKSRYPILIDTGMPADMYSLLKALQPVGIAVQDITLIIQTHAHIDHCGGTFMIRRLSSAQVAIHREDSGLLKAGINGQLKAHSLTGRLLKEVLPQRYTGIVPDIVYEDILDLNAFGINAQLLHTPGHTAGSSSVIFGDGHVIVGDLLMGGYAGGYLFPHLARPHYFVQSAGQVYHSLQRLLSLGMQWFHPGHGACLSRRSVERMLTNHQHLLSVEEASLDKFS